jgi:ribosome-binding protein aMBF1 (putative translation factor)
MQMTKTTDGPVAPNAPAVSKAPQSTCAKNEKELPRDDKDIYKVRYMDAGFVNQVISARISRKLNRKQLAARLCVRESVISDLETGRALYSGGLVSKLKKELAL